LFSKGLGVSAIIVVVIVVSFFLGGGSSGGSIRLLIAGCRTITQLVDHRVTPRIDLNNGKSFRLLT